MKREIFMFKTFKPTTSSTWISSTGSRHCMSLYLAASCFSTVRETKAAQSRELCSDMSGQLESHSVMSASSRSTWQCRLDSNSNHYYQPTTTNTPILIWDNDNWNDNWPARPNPLHVQDQQVQPTNLGRICNKHEITHHFSSAHKEDMIHTS